MSETNNECSLRFIDSEISLTRERLVLLEERRQQLLLFMCGHAPTETGDPQ